MTLAELPSGTPAIIRNVKEENPLVARLYELGFLPGETIVVEKRAPLGDPIEVSLLHYQLCLRKTEARCIEVEPL